MKKLYSTFILILIFSPHLFSQANLIPDIFTATSTVTNCGFITVTVDEHNTGNVNAGANYVKLYFSNDANLGDANDVYVGQIFISQGPNANNYSPLYQQTFLVPSNTTTGLKYFYFWLDATNVISESNNNDNYSSRMVQVNSASIPIPSVTFGGTSCPGNVSSSTVPLTWTGSNSSYGFSISKYPYGSSNITYTASCVSGTSLSLSDPSLQAGMLYRWNMSGYNDPTCASCQSGTSNTRYFYITPSINPSSSQTICTGQSVTFTTPNLTINSPGLLNYQWLLNGSPINGQTGASYVATAAGNYSVQLTYSGSTNCSGTLTIQSNSVSITVQSCCTGVSIITQPQSQTKTAGNTATFSVAVSGTTPYLYFWYKNNVQISGATSSSYTTPPLTISDNGNIYKCIVTNCSSQNQAISNNATLTVTCAAVSIASQPSNQTVPEGSTASFNISLNGTSPFSYQWYKNNNAISGATNSSYTTPSLNLNDNGNIYKCIVTNCSAGNSVSSNNVMLTVNSTTPTVNSITFTNDIENHPGITPLYTLYAGSAYITNNPIKICADGSTATYIKVNVSNTSNISFRILDGNNNLPISDIAKDGQLGTPYISGNNIEVSYTHPQYLDAGLFKVLTLQILYNGTPINGINFPLNIYRAPVLFVHGLWGNVNSLLELENYLIDNNLYPQYDNILSYTYDSHSPLSYRADYEATNAVHFAQNQSAVPSALSNLLLRTRGQYFSASKADLICHSMGGILSRQYLDGKYQLYRNDIHKLITLNTPNKGTQAANYLQWWGNGLLRRELLLTNNEYKCDLGAVDDLFVNSSEIQDLNKPTAQANKVPSHTLSTVGYHIGFSNNDVEGESVLALLSFALNCHNIYNSEQNDLIVPLSSQLSGIFQSVNPVAYDHWHVGSSENSNVKTAVENLINSSPLGSDFISSGFGTDNLLQPPIAHFCNSSTLQALTFSTDSIKIISPSYGQNFNAGDSVQVNIISTGNVSRIIFFAGNGITDALSLDSIVAHFMIKFKIPDQAYGKFTLSALGTNATDFLALDSIYININAIATLDSIKIIPDSLSLEVFKQNKFHVNGYFSDGLKRDLTNSSSLNFSVDTNIARLIENGFLEGKATGNTSLIVSSQGKLAQSKIHIYVDSSLFVTAFSSDVNNICKNSSVAFSDYSYGNPISRNWSFPGGTPLASSSKNPIITYNTPGTYNVSLITSWSEKIDTLIFPNYVTVNICPLTLNLKVYIQGLYSGGGTMVPQIPEYPSLCDTITVELHDHTSPYKIAYSIKGPIDTGGNGSFIFPSMFSDSYYIVIKHRNSLETWSKNPIPFDASIVSFDFTSP